ncbi:discoidin domain-containing protein, partial [Paenibacillus sepulcri]|nr:discoidin domain-containing protein [Paenibacillus sepulcri]
MLFKGVRLHSTQKLKWLLLIGLTCLFGIMLSPGNTRAEDPVPDIEPGAIHVSPQGSDSGDGSEAAPFQTLEKARDEVRSILASGDQTADIVVYLHGGTYNLTQTLLFTNEDSGKNGHQVIYQAYPGEHPILSGGQEITGWESIGGGVFKAPIGNLEFRQLYVNDNRAVRARTPNIGEFFRVKRWDRANQDIYVNQSEVAGIQNPQKVEMVIQTYWSDQHMLIESMNVSGDEAVIKPQNPGRDVIFNRTAPQMDPKQAYHFENALEFMDLSGEFYLDKENSELFYRPRFGEDMARAYVVVPVLESLVKVTGTLDQTVKNMKFIGLSFQHTGWNLPTQQGYTSTQASFYPIMTNYDGKVPAAFSVEAAENIVFERNTFQNLGGTGLDLISATNNVDVIGNVFKDISANGVNVESGLSILKQVPADPRTIVKQTLVANNFITRVGQDYYGAVGIFGGFTEALTVEHNELTDLPYSAISVGWGWTINTTQLKDNIIRYNDIHHVMKQMVDGAGIYTLSKQPNSQIYENFIHDFDRSPWAAPPTDPTKNWFPVVGIYLDQATEGYAVERNVIVNVPTPIFANRFKLGADTYTDNYGDFASIKANAGLTAQYKDISIPVKEYDPIKPELLQAITDEEGTKIELTFSEAISPSSLDPERFILNGTAATVASVVMNTYLPNNNAVILQTNGILEYQHPITLTMAEGALQDPAFNKNALTEQFSITNQVRNPYVIDLEITGSPILSVNDTAALHPFVKTRDNVPVTSGPEEWQFVSANPAIATVDAQTGEIQALGAGETYVTITTEYNDIVVTAKLDLYISAAGQIKPAFVNIAKNKQSYSTGTIAGPNFGSEKALDGNIQTLWTTAGTGTLTADLSDLYHLFKIQRIEVVTRQDTDQQSPRRNFELQASNRKDFATYTVLGSQNELTLPYRSTWTVNLPEPQSFQYIRFSKPIDYAAVAELRVIAEYDTGEDLSLTWPEGSVLQAFKMDDPGKVRLEWSLLDPSYNIASYNVNVDGRAPLTVTGSVYSTTISNWPENVPVTAKVEAVNTEGRWSMNGPSVSFTANWPDYHIELNMSGGSPVMNAGETLQLQPVLTHDNGTVIEGETLWQYESLNPSIATVNAQTGLINAVGSGDAQIKITGVHSDGNFITKLDLFIVAAGQTKPETVNLAKRKPTTATSAFSATYGADKAVDGNNSSLWTTSVPGSLTVDLGESYRYYDITRIEVVTRQDADQQSTRKLFTVQGSNQSDFADITVLGSQNEEVLPYRATWSIELPQPVSFRYIRFVKPVNYAAVAELRVIAKPKQAQMLEEQALEDQAPPQD